MSVAVRKFRRGGWEVDIIVRLPDGTKLRERRKVSLSSKTAAKRWGEELERRLSIHGKQLKKEVPTLSEFAGRYIEEYAKAEQLKPRTIKERERIIEHDLKPRFGSMKLDAISAADVQKLKAGLMNKKPSTVNNVLNALSTMLKCAVSWGVVSQAPAVKLVKADKLGDPQFYEPHDYERLVEAAAAIDPRIHLFVLLGGDAGLRCGEILALEQSDVDLQRGVLTVNRSESEGFITSPKGRRGRKIELTVRLRDALAANRHLRGDRVLWRDDGFPKVSQVLLAKWMIRAQRRANLRATGGIHILRHTFCSRLAMAGASTRAIQELAGHANIGTTQRYMHLSPAAKSVAIGLLDKGADLAASGAGAAGGVAVSEEKRGDTCGDEKR